MEKIFIPTYSTDIPEIKVVKMRAPLFVQIELTEQCQYNCYFCYNVWKPNINKTKKSLTEKELDIVIDKLIECEIFSAIFSGGEPTLCDFLIKNIEKLVSHKIETSIITNGANLDIPYVKKLKESGLKSVQVSMHHYQENKMDEITNCKTSYKKTLDGIKNLVSIFGSNDFNVNMVVSKTTIADVYHMGIFLNNVGVKHFSVGIVSYSGNAQIERIVMDKNDLKKVYSQLKILHEKTKMHVGLVGGIPFCLFPNLKSNKVEMMNVCDAGIYQIVIGPDGTIRPCVEMSTIVGNAITDDISYIWQNSDELIKIRQFKNIPLKCIDCKHVAICHGGCRAAAYNYTKDIRGIDPLMEVL